MTGVPARHELVPLSDGQRWDEALHGLVHAPAHTRHHAAAFALSSPDEVTLYVLRDAEGLPVVCCVLAVRGGPGTMDAYTPYGFGGFVAARPVAGFGQLWDSFARSQGWVASYALQHPLVEAPEPFPEDVERVSGDTYVVDLRPEPADLLRRMSSGRRTELARWTRAAGVLEEDRTAIAGFFAAEAPRFFADRGASPTYRFAAPTWEALTHAPNTVAFGARGPSGLVAAALFNGAGTLGEYVFSVSVPGTKGVSGPLVWEGMLALRRRGVTTLHLGGGVRPGDGVARFKQQFGVSAVPLRHLRFVHRPDVYARLCSRAGCDTGDDGYFPPYRRPA